jgi:hypothetical protein
MIREIENKLEMITGKHSTEKETPPTPLHRNLVNQHVYY